MTSLDDVVRSTEHRLLRLALMLSGSRHNAEDLVQSVLARAHRQWERIGGLEHPEAYLRTMVVNEYLGWRRLLTRLPRKQRAVLVLRYYEDLADSDIAEILGVSPATVRSNAARALATLRDHLSAEEAN